MSGGGTPDRILPLKGFVDRLLGSVILVCVVVVYFSTLLGNV